MLAEALLLQSVALQPAGCRFPATPAALFHSPHSLTHRTLNAVYTRLLLTGGEVPGPAVAAAHGGGAPEAAGT